MDWRFKRSPTNLTVEHLYKMTPLYNVGVFNQASTAFFPWDSSFDTPVEINKALDDVYLDARSGGKFASPYLMKKLESIKNSYTQFYEEGVLPPSTRIAITETFYLRFFQKWTHIWETYLREYNPLNNSSSSETRTRSGAGSKTGSRTNTKNLTDTHVHPIRTIQNNSLSTPATSETTTLNTTDELTHGHVVTHPTSTNETVSNNVFGFNTSQEGGVPESKSTTVQTNTSTETHSGKDTTKNTGTTTKAMSGTDTLAETSTETYTGTDTQSHTGTDSDSSSDSFTENETTTVVRSGTLYRAPAELLSLDRDFWLWDYFEMVFEDVDSILALPFYSESPVKHFYWGQE